VLGRVAFAPLPHVKPTTDIVLLSGYVLGPAPGFAIGAITAITSNLFFGQGPWTPWQMAGWGSIGVMGAWLGVLTRTRLGRWPLALVCGAAGIYYGTLLDLSTWVTFTGQQTPGQYLAIWTSSLGFTIAHAVGNIVFCLAFGPAFIRTLRRFQERLDVRWTPVSPPTPHPTS
jgi:energy-coupling factor transport system substrate-specific component